MSARLVDAVLVLVAVEAAGFVMLGRRTLLLNLAAGAALLLALRLGIDQSSPGPVMLCLAAAGLAHLADLRVRWRQSP